MNNSFYYFFSAVPQVLAGILALFGVFVIFKIETIKKQLLGMGQFILDEGNVLIKPPSFVQLSDKESNPNILEPIKKAISRLDIKGLKNIIGKIDYQPFDVVKERYNSVYDYLQSLNCQTITWSGFTAFIIIICLSALPLDNFLLKHNFILNFLFVLIIVSIVVCLGGLILILKKALKEIDFPQYQK